MMTKKLPRLTIVVPCYNEEAVLPSSAKTLGGILTKLIAGQQVTTDSKILFVDDGSHDQTWETIQTLQAQNALFTGLKFSRNYGQEVALMAGLRTAAPYSDLTITIDADLQDNPYLIPTMVQQAADGFDIVYGVRNDRSSDTWFKRNTAQRFYWLMNKIGVHLIPNHADYRMMTRCALTALLRYHETDPFIRGIVPQLGFPSTKLYYKRRPRTAGVSKYPLSKMLKLALNGIFSFSLVPIRAIMGVGSLVCLAALVAFGWLGIDALRGITTAGIGPIMASLWLLGGLQLMALGIIGEYVGRTFAQSKHRPAFIIETDTYSNEFVQKNTEGTRFQHQPS
ncbi:glycosyltransferase [Levilactobacillus namurensis]|uniref:glycosyltransferase n=1 Tax=Levilactobacillus namurensis TaxID=380393 RepID=UPI000464740D|nr:glycosyltransferase [Levilactobacillus namurensis]